MDTILNEGAGLENARQAWAARNPMGRMGTPTELTGPVVLLCSNAGTYMNGADLVVDGESSMSRLFTRLLRHRLMCISKAEAWFSEPGTQFRDRIARHGVRDC